MALTLKSFCAIWLCIGFCTGFSYANNPAENNHTHTEKTERYFQSIKNQPAALKKFLQQMPKGGDLHLHESGSTLAENMLQYAASDELCVNRKNFTVFSNPNCPAEDSLASALLNPSFRHGLIDSWSMRHFNKKPSAESGHDHFFNTFLKYAAISWAHRGDIQAEIMQRAGLQNELYLEIMITPDHDEARLLGKKIGWNPDLSALRHQLLSNDFNDILSLITQSLNEDEARARDVLNCNTQIPKAGCRITVRYLYQVLREQPPEMVFAQLLAGFESASKDPRIVGINLVQPEDGVISMRDYQLHMNMIAFLHRLYPKVHISLHAGELNESLVDTQGLSFHIHDAVKTASAERIGHGADIAHEENFAKLLQEMADKHILVEINLSSNAYILNMAGKNHPLPLYLQYRVPLALSTDDEGVSRENLTQQYLRAVADYDLSYITLKTLARNSLTYAFIPGERLWQNDEYQQMALPCQHDVPDVTQPSEACRRFLDSSEKARLQWQLEVQFTEFERSYQSSVMAQ